MKRVVLTALLVAAMATTASAGGFIGLGVGTAPGINSDLQMTENGRTGRLELGYQFGRISVEGMAGRTDLLRTDGYGWQYTTLGLAGKYNLPLSDGFQLYGRLGYQHTTLDPMETARETYEGSGLFGGVGVEFRLPVAVANLALFVDYTISHSSMSSPPVLGTEEVGFTTRIWTLGAKLGF
jgi:hypothetical protein